VPEEGRPDLIQGQPQPEGEPSAATERDVPPEEILSQKFMTEIHVSAR